MLLTTFQLFSRHVRQWFLYQVIWISKTCPSLQEVLLGGDKIMADLVQNLGVVTSSSELSDFWGYHGGDLKAPRTITRNSTVTLHIL